MSVLCVDFQVANRLDLNNNSTRIPRPSVMIVPPFEGLSSKWLFSALLLLQEKEPIRFIAWKYQLTLSNIPIFKTA